MLNFWSFRFDVQNKDARITADFLTAVKLHKRYEKLKPVKGGICIFESFVLGVEEGDQVVSHLIMGENERGEEYFVVKAIETSGAASLPRLLSVETIDSMPHWISIVHSLRSDLFERPSSVSDR